MDGYTRQPSGEECVARKLAEILICPDVGVLYHIFGFSVIAQNRSRNTIEALIVAAHDDLIQGGVTGLYSLDHLKIGQAFGAGFFQSSDGWHSSLPTESGAGKRLQVPSLKRQKNETGPCVTDCRFDALFR